MITCPVLYYSILITVDNPLHLMLERCEGFSFTFDPALTVSKTVEQ